MKRWKQASWFLAAVLAVTIVGVAVQAVSVTAITSGATIITIGDSWVVFGRIEKSDSSVRGMVVSTNSAMNGQTASLTTNVAGRHLTGQISSAGVNSGSFGNSTDLVGSNIRGSYSITFVGADTGTGTASKTATVGGTAVSFAAGETGAMNRLTTAFADPWAGASLSSIIGDGGSNLSDSNLLVVSAQSDLGGSILADTNVYFQVTGLGRGLATDSSIIIGVFDVEGDTFVSYRTVHAYTGASNEDTFDVGSVRFDTGVNFVYIAGRANDSSAAAFKDSSIFSGDSVVAHFATVIIVDSATGGSGSGSTAGSGTVSSTTSLADTTKIVVSGDTINVIVTVTPISGASALATLADSNTPSATVMDTYLFDFQAFANGEPLENLAAVGAQADIFITIKGPDSAVAIAKGFDIVRLNRTTNTWEAWTAANGLVTRFARNEDKANNQVTYHVLVNKLDGVGGGVGGFGGTTILGGGGDGDCVINNAFGNTPLAGMMPSLRDVRDTMLRSSFGRMLVSSYYSFGAMLLIVAGLGLTVAVRRR